RDEEGHDQLVEGGDEGEDRTREHAGPDDREHDLPEGAPRRSPEIERRLLEPQVEAVERRGDVDDDEGDREGGVREDQGERMAHEPDARIEEIDSDRHDDDRCDQRRKNEGVDRLPARKAPAHQPDRGRRAEAGRQHHDGGADPDAEPGGIQPIRAAEEVAVPLQAEARRREAQIECRGERERNDDEDREDQIEEDHGDEGAEPGGHAAPRTHGLEPAPHVRPPPKARSTASVRTKTAKTMRAAASRPTARAEAKGQFKRSTCCWMSTAIMRSRGPPTSAGVMKKPSARMKTRRQPAEMPGSESGSTTWRKTPSGLAPRPSAARRRFSSSPRITP